MALLLLLIAPLWLALRVSDPGDGRLLFGAWKLRDVGIAMMLWLTGAGVAAAAVSRRALFRFALCVSLAATSWLLLEIPGLLGLVSYPRLLGPGYSEMGRYRAPNVDVVGETMQDTASRWGLDATPVPFHYQTNALGFRNRPGQSDADVYLLGDSIVVGALVPFEQTVTARLEALVGRPVMNLSLIGVGPQQEHALFFRTGAPVRDRLVLQFLFEGNDLADSNARRRATAEARGRLFRRSLTRNAVFWLQRRTQPVAGIVRRRTCQIGGQTYTFRWARETMAAFDGELPAILLSVLEFQGRIEREGGRFGVVFVPSKLRVLGPHCETWPERSDLRDLGPHLPEFREPLAAWCEEQDIPCLDLTAHLEAAAGRGEMPWFWGDTHWTEAGHDAAAEALASWRLLQESGPGS